MFSTRNATAVIAIAKSRRDSSSQNCSICCENGFRVGPCGIRRDRSRGGSRSRNPAGILQARKPRQTRKGFFALKKGGPNRERCINAYGPAGTFRAVYCNHGLGGSRFCRTSRRLSPLKVPPGPFIPSTVITALTNMHSCFCQTCPRSEVPPGPFSTADAVHSLGRYAFLPTASAGIAQTLTLESPARTFSFIYCIHSFERGLSLTERPMSPV